MSEPPPWTSGNFRDILELVELGFDYQQSGVYRRDVGGDFSVRGATKSRDEKLQLFFSSKFFFSFFPVAHRGLPILSPP